MLTYGIKLELFDKIFDLYFRLCSHQGEGVGAFHQSCNAVENQCSRFIPEEEGPCYGTVKILNNGLIN